jgi:hypothetical protein
MQVASSQAARAFAALRASRRRGAVRRRRRARPARLVSPVTLDLALATIDDLPPTQEGRVADARHSVARGHRPAAAEVADMVVRRSVCDQLR